jgi:hypothetical protein
MQSVEPKQEKRRHLKHFRQLFPCKDSAMMSVEPKQEKRRHLKHFRHLFPCKDSTMQSVEPKQEKRRHLIHFQQLFPCMHNAMIYVEPKTREKTIFQTFPIVVPVHGKRNETHKATQEKRRHLKPSLTCNNILHPHCNLLRGANWQKKCDDNRQNCVWLRQFYLFANISSYFWDMYQFCKNLRSYAKFIFEAKFPIKIRDSDNSHI